MVDGTPTTLYRLFDAGGDLLYVGIAGNPGRRFEQHAAAKPWWKTVDTIKLQHFDHRAEAHDAERDAIAYELPCFNIQHVPTEGRWARPWPGTLRRYGTWCPPCLRSGALAWKALDHQDTIPHAVWVEGDTITTFHQCNTCGHKWQLWANWRVDPTLVEVA